jgi:integrase
MDTLIKHRNQYLSKIQKWNGIKQVATHIPLRTNQKSVAVVRHHRVEQSENNIKDGIIVKAQFNEYFEWLNDKGTSTLKEQTLQDAIDLFVKSHQVNVSHSSIVRIKVSMNCMLKVWKKNTPIKQITTKHIEDFKIAYTDKHKVAGINLNLRNIKTFLRYCVDEKMLRYMPKIKMLREPKKLPKYLSEQDIRTLLSADNLSDFMRHTFYFLVTTGCRRSEVIEGVLDGKILIVPASLSKSRIEKEITLNDTQVGIVKEIHKARDTYLLKGFKLYNFKNNITKSFDKACKRVGLKGYTLHCLRHTFAVSQWIVSNDIYEVKNLLGHTSVKTTERYARFNLDRLAQDFPSAYQVRLEVEKVRKNGISTQMISTQINKSEESSREDTATA